MGMDIVIHTAYCTHPLYVRIRDEGGIIESNLAGKITKGKKTVTTIVKGVVHGTIAIR